MHNTLVVLVQDHPGVLNRTVSLFRRRGFNIASLTVGASETPGVSRMTLVVDASAVEQVTKQLYRLIEVIKVADVTDESTVEREMALVRVHAPSAARAGVLAVATAYGARVLDVGATAMVLEITGTPAKVDSFVEIVRPFGLQEMMRTGRIAMVRGMAPGLTTAARRGATGSARHHPVLPLPTHPAHPTHQPSAADGTE
ncbi:MAG: acetolactate synthase small subunit [Gemmatimonadaceae bacterium]